MSSQPAPPPVLDYRPADRPSGNILQLVLATGAFAVCFAVFGSVSAMMPLLKKQMGLNPVQVSVALAIPVLLGSLGRIPLGILTDRFGGRIIFLAVMLISAASAGLMGFVTGYAGLIACGFVLGIALASFAVGVGFVSGWYSPQKQGTALGVYGAGNIGQSLAAYGSPVLVAYLGMRWGFWAFAVLTIVWLILFAAFARNAPLRGPQKTFRDFLLPLKDSMSWVLSLYYFLTFGGFVAMAVYLPTLLSDPDTFGLSTRDAGLRTAGFVVLATLLRPIGGALADRVGGRRILLWVFPVTAAMAIFLACPRMDTFTVGALGMAAAIGLGNGAVFKLVPEYFPRSVGSVTGLVGAAGGLGGFFPPLVLGVLKQTTGSFAWGFIFLAVFGLFCLTVLLLVGQKPTASVACPMIAPIPNSEVTMPAKKKTWKLPGTYKQFITRFPALGEAHEMTARAVDAAGPMDRKTCELVKIGICVGGGLESALRSHVRRALQSGATIPEIEQAVLLGMNTVGFPRTVAAWSWAWQQIDRKD